jgi:hypothetical protein
VQNYDLNFYLEKIKVNRRKKIIKIRAEMNDIRTRKIKEKSAKPTAASLSTSIKLINCQQNDQEKKERRHWLQIPVIRYVPSVQRL